MFTRQCDCSGYPGVTTDGTNWTAGCTLCGKSATPDPDRDMALQNWNQCVFPQPAAPAAIEE